MSLPSALNRLTTATADAPVCRETLCAHCGTPVASGDLEPDVDRQFCCSGCRTVYQILEQTGLSGYYAVRDSTGADPQPSRTTHRSYEAFDDPQFRSIYCRSLPGGLVTVDLYLEGVHCSACVWLVERVPMIVEGNVGARLDFGRSMVTLTYDPSQSRLSELGRALDRLGYPPHPVRGGEALQLRRQEQRRLMIRMGIAAAAAGNAMLMALALYSGEFSGMEPAYVSLFRWGSFWVTLPAVLYGAWPFFKGALGAIRGRTAHMDLPIAVGITAGFLGGCVATWRGTGGVYFDTITVLIFLLLVGRWIQLRQQDLARSAAELLYSLAPATARRVEPDGVKQVPAESLLAGDQVEILANEHVPADGIVVEGTSTIDTSLLTGEPIPELVAIGSPVAAGTTNIRSAIRVRVERAGIETRISKLMQAVESAAQRRARVVRVADRISGVFVVVVLLLAVLTVAIWGIWDWSRGIDNAIALLVVTCPCALGMATPLAVTAALGKAARLGIFVKGGDALEALAEAELVVLDKTGTLTEGRLELVAWEGALELRAAALALERQAVHPVADAMMRALGSEARDCSVEDLVHHPGGGVMGTVDGRPMAIGSPRWFETLGYALDEGLKDKLLEHVKLGHTPVCVGCGGRVVALALFADRLRADAQETITQFEAMGIRSAVLSGDDDRVVKALQAQIGRPLEFAMGGASPESKLAKIERLAQDRRVVMVGDGVNDAAALSAASVGIAVHGGAEVSLAAADAFLTEPGLFKIIQLFVGARRTFAVIRRGLVFSLAYNLIGTAFAMLGLLNPLVAAILMPLSSLTVVTNAYRSRTFETLR